MFSEGGSCEPYMGTVTGKFSPCDQYFIEGVDFVYIPKGRANGSQLAVRNNIEDLVDEGGIDFLSPTCRGPIIRLLCFHVYLLCGSNGTYHVPRFVCSDLCSYLSETCPTDYQRIQFLLLQIQPKFVAELGLDVTNCSNNRVFIKFLDLEDDCCTDAGVSIPFASVRHTGQQYTKSCMAGI